MANRKWSIESLQKIINIFFKEYLEYIFFYNYHLRPKGVFPTIKSFLRQKNGQGAYFYEIYPAQKSSLKIPDDIWKYQSSYINFPRTTMQSQKFIAKVPKGRIYTDCHKIIAIISDDNKVIGDISIDLNLKEDNSIANSRIFKKRYFQKVEYFRGVVYPIVAGGGSYTNYYHWMIDSISRISLIRSAGLFERVDWFYVPTIKYDYQIDTLRILGIQKEKVIESNKYPHICSDEILAPSYVRGEDAHISNWAIEFLNHVFPPTNLDQFANGRYYISRKDSSMRTIVNENDVIKLLSKYGFETIILSNLNFQEKVNLFASAKVLIGGSGAGLTNLVFAREGATIVEIFGDQFVELVHYSAIAYKRKLKHYICIGENIKVVNNVVDGQKNSIRLNIDRLKRLLDEELKLKSGTNQNKSVESTPPH